MGRRFSGCYRRFIVQWLGLVNAAGRLMICASKVAKLMPFLLLKVTKNGREKKERIIILLLDINANIYIVHTSSLSQKMSGITYTNYYIIDFFFREKAEFEASKSGSHPKNGSILSTSAFAIKKAGLTLPTNQKSETSDTNIWPK